jgi:hypothetical protein
MSPATMGAFPLIRVRFLQQYDRDHARRVLGSYLDVVWE